MSVRPLHLLVYVDVEPKCLVDHLRVRWRRAVELKFRRQLDLALRLVDLSNLVPPEGCLAVRC